MAGEVAKHGASDARWREGDPRLLPVLDSAVAFIGILETDGTLVEANAPALEAGGLRRDDVIGKKFWDSYWWSHDPFEIDRMKDAVRRAAGGETVRYDAVVRMAGDTRMTIEFMLSPLRAAGGEVVALVPSGFDITERKRAEEKLRAAHDTFRHLVDRSPFGIYTVDADFRLAQVSDGAQKVFENVRPLIGRDFAEVLRIIWPEPFASEAIGLFRHTLATGEPYRAPSTVEKRADIDVTEAYDWKIERLNLPDGRPGVVCHFYDLSERQRHEEQITMLMREVNHRSKNLLSLVLSIARQTAAATPDDFVERFTQRIQGLSASQDVLVNSGWHRIPLGELVRAQLGHFEGLLGERIELSGPPVEINAAAAQAIGLALHELATNAAKYGALSDAAGKVAISWQTTANGAEPRFEMTWVETGGPPVTPTERHGFGSVVTGNLVKTSVAGEVETEFRPEGLSWSLSCPAVNVAESERLAPRRELPLVADGAATRRKRILVVDDEPLIAMEIASILEDAGYGVVGPAHTLDAALALVGQSPFAAAVLDVNLGSATSEPLARKLAQQGIPFMTISGYNRDQLPEVLKAAPWLGKPLDPGQLVETIGRCFRDA